MNPIRLLRKQASITQQALATRGGTSQPTIALYERGIKSPRLATLQKLSASVGLDLVIAFVPRLTREDQRSLAYHQAVAEILRLNSVGSIKRAGDTLQRMRKLHSGALELFDRWSAWLQLPTEELITKILDPGTMARDMRQVSPFAGLLSAKERVRILTQFRREYS